MHGIVTFHDGINYGAYLQVYALQNYLKQLGIDSEIINYKNKKHEFNEYKCFLYTKNLKKFLNSFSNTVNGLSRLKLAIDFENVVDKDVPSCHKLE